MARIKAGVASLNPKSLIIFTRKVIAKMTGNPNFPTPTPDLADLQTKLDEFESQAVTAVNGTSEDRYIRDETAKELKQMLRVLANYVAMTAAGDGEIILSSGFSLRRENEPVPPLSIPAALMAKRSSHSGMVELDWNRVAHTQTYQVEMTTTDPTLSDAQWVMTGLTSKSRFQVTNLTPGRYYWFRVKAIGRNDSSGYSDPAVVMAA